jgi:glucose-1-phosphate thymidylyltransferase
MAVTDRKSLQPIADQATDVVGLVPAAGTGKRIAPLPCSKELFPIGFAMAGENTEPQPKVVSQYLLEKYRQAGVRKAIVILREGKWDIPAYFGDGSRLDMDLAYVVIADSCGPPDTLDRAYPFVRGKVVTFGFPDIMFGPESVYSVLLDKQVADGLDLALGLYVAHDCRRMDMVDFDATGRIRSMVLKPDQSELRYAWLCGVWTPVFTDFLHEYLASSRRNRNLDQLRDRKIDAQGDLPVGAVIQAAIKEGLRVGGVPFPDEKYIDIGTPDDLVEAVVRFRFR